MLKITLRVLALLVFLVCSIWVYAEPGKFDPWVAAMAALVVFLSLFIPFPRKSPDQLQDVKAGSNGLQAGRDININVEKKGGR